MKHHTLEDGLYATRGLNDKYEVILKIFRKDEESQQEFHSAITDPVIKQAIIGTRRTTEKKTQDEEDDETDDKKKSGAVKRLEKEKRKAKLEAEAKKKKEKEYKQRMAKKK
jgi:hypothetical protein